MKRGRGELQRSREKSEEDEGGELKTIKGSLLKTSARFSRDLLLAILISSYIKTLLSSHCHDGLLSNATWPSD
ncbi:hypothetical protein V6N11_015869 [Hibiscus sabdariffa]|uniref:Uncharacterized protein n=1 Tax=Hibiscus sabdariffa TaxID=183260 RepID=A0ABR2TTY6_9ROSI